MQGEGQVCEEGADAELGISCLTKRRSSSPKEMPLSPSKSDGGSPSLMPPPRSRWPTAPHAPPSVSVVSAVGTPVSDYSDSDASCSTPPHPPPSESAADKEVAGDSAGGGGKKRKSSSSSRLSFMDDLDEGADNLNTSEHSMSKATAQRFKKERSRKRQATAQEHTAIFDIHSPQQHHQPSTISTGPSPPPLSLAELTAMPEHIGTHGAPGEWWTCLDSIRRRPGRVVDDDDDKNQAWSSRLRVRHGVSAKQGKRPYMEDAHFAIRDFLSSGCHLFGVLDGHGGCRASHYAKEEMPRKLLQHLYRHREEMGTKQEIAKAIQTAFLEADKEFLDMARKESLRDGTTALISFLRNTKLYVGWVGDSRGLLCRQGRFIRASEDHKPDRPAERRAIESRGGTVIFSGTYRVAGPTALAVSRVLGDIQMKEPRKLVIADPEINTFDLTPDDEFLILASDGLFDVMDDQNVVSVVAQHLKEHNSCCEAADHLASMALEKGSTDNVTVLIVQFMWGERSQENEQVQ